MKTSALAMAAEWGPVVRAGAGRAYKLLVENETGETVMATPASSDGVRP